MAVGGVGAAPAEAAAEVDGGIEPMGNPSFHCSNISSGFFSPFLPGGDKDPIRGGSTAGRQAGAGGGEGGTEGRKEGREKRYFGRVENRSRDQKCTRVGSGWERMWWEIKQTLVVSMYWRNSNKACVPSDQIVNNGRLQSCFTYGLE